MVSSVTLTGEERNSAYFSALPLRTVMSVWSLSSAVPSFILTRRSSQASATRVISDWSLVIAEETYESVSPADSTTGAISSSVMPRLEMSGLIMFSVLERFVSIMSMPVLSWFVIIERMSDTVSAHAPVMFAASSTKLASL